MFPAGATTGTCVPEYQQALINGSANQPLECIVGTGSGTTFGGAGVTVTTAYNNVLGHCPDWSTTGAGGGLGWYAAQVSGPPNYTEAQLEAILKSSPEYASIQADPTHTFVSKEVCPSGYYYTGGSTTLSGWAYCTLDGY
jgi:hypothetical protein